RLDRYQHMPVGVVVVVAARQPFAIVHREIELELIGAAGGGVGARGEVEVGADIAVAEIERRAPFRSHAGSRIEQGRKLGERDGFGLVELANGLALAEQRYKRRSRPRRKCLQIDRRARPWRAHSCWWC